jgi:hypothetical protein
VNANTVEMLIGALAIAVIAVVALVVGNVGKHMTPPPVVDVEEPDQVELPDHRIMDRALAQIIGAPTTAWGESERLQYRPEDFESAMHCLTCEREILPGQWFWQTPLLNKQTRLPLGVSFQNCLSCQPGDLEAIVHGR